MDERIKDLEQDVEDSRIQVVQAEKDIQEAKDWHYNMLVNYANSIKLLDEYKKTL